jgi:hypothetical protein
MSPVVVSSLGKFMRNEKSYQKTERFPKAQRRLTKHGQWALQSQWLEARSSETWGCEVWNFFWDNFEIEIL